MSRLPRPEPLDPFALFAAYHLSVTPEGEYHFANLHEVAARFGVAPEAVSAVLARERLDPDSILAAGFDLLAAQMDATFASSPVERMRIARRHYEALRAATASLRRADEEARAWPFSDEQPPAV